MKNISNQELMALFLASKGALTHLSASPFSAQRRNKYEIDFQSLGDPFVRDTGVIDCSKAWRRLGYKNQVASSSNTPHIRNRATHVAEVKAISTRLADWLGLNVHLTNAIATGHDIGHVPLGHQGESYLQRRLNLPFCHEVMGVIIAQFVERRCLGMNLTYQTLDGMHRHSGKRASDEMTQEAWLVRHADKIAYLFADYNDFDRLEWSCGQELVDLMDWFGFSQRDRSFRTMVALCQESAAATKVVFEKSEAAVNFNRLRTLMYEEYTRVVEQDVERILDPIWSFLERDRRIVPWLGISLLTDDEVCRLSSTRSMLNSKELMGTGLGEIIRDCKEAGSLDRLNTIDCCHLGLDWYTQKA